MSGPDDAIYNYGRASQLYFYADRRPASRFIYDRPFWLDPPTLDEAVEDLRASRPVLIVDTMAPRDHPLWEKAHPPPIRELLETEYEFVERVEFADIYRLKE